MLRHILRLWCVDRDGQHNFFWDETDCTTYCKSPHMVTTQKCLNDWGERDLPAGQEEDFKIAFNIYIGKFAPYVKMCTSCDEPMLFDTIEECNKYCIADQTYL
ncbi:hypothetical protein RF11_08868 [Thelohanellus kitauei]|uniref:BPTI/Kunitz inhibitor domain-containing protein n=1 Tax=Thelohanellus kitauei TaxID=669202 RepID=A0A0C2N1S8_THEKT|nr:hypothetical protein RF11_08868 [Thelohanellus kitauei]